MLMKKSNYLFAYGFLKTIYHGNSKTQTPAMDVEFISSGLYQGHIYRIGRYPGVIYDPGADYRVKGEVFKMNNPEMLLPVLDKYEHSLPLIIEDPEYKRVLRPIKTEKGLIDCWVYEYLNITGEHLRIESGEF